MAKKRPRTPERRYFDRLRLRHVRCFRDTEIPLDPRVTVVIGANGSGKTTLVEAIGALTGGSDEPPAEFPLRWKTRNAEISLLEAGNRQPAASWKVQSGQSALERLPEERFLFAYGRYRRVLYPEDIQESPSDPATDLDELASTVNQRRTSTLYRPDNHLLRDISRYVAALHFGARSNTHLEELLKHLNDSLALLGHGLSGITMVEGAHQNAPRVIRNGVPLELRELSDGYQALLVIIFDLLLRYAFLPGHPSPLEREATVVIDEVDLHLHPRWQRTVIRQLVEIFPATQFILTTHSAAVVQGAIDEGMNIVRLKEKGDAVETNALRPERMHDLQGAEIGAVLLEDELFGVESRYSPEIAKIEKRVADMRYKIDDGTLSEEDEERLFEDLNELKMLMAKDEERRADGSFMSQLAELRISLLKELAADLRTRRS